MIYHISDEDPRHELKMCHPPRTYWQLQASLKLLARAQSLAWSKLSVAERQKFLNQAEQMESK